MSIALTQGIELPSSHFNVLC